VTGNPNKTVFDLRRETKQTICHIADCETKIYIRNLCHNHYRRWKNYGNPEATELKSRPYGTKKCMIDDCQKKHMAKGYCQMHYCRWKKYGDPMITRQKGFSLDTGGYVWKNGMAEHRLVMEQVLNRKLLPGENVHHRNGNRQDNRPENLELWSVSQPPGQRVEDKVKWALELIAFYAPERLKDIDND
jgi:hypothetical protein